MLVEYSSAGYYENIQETFENSKNQRWLIPFWFDTTFNYSAVKKYLLSSWIFYTFVRLKWFRSSNKSLFYTKIAGVTKVLYDDFIY